jgi:uncharacterized protein YecE (DUF72 family)
LTTDFAYFRWHGHGENLVDYKYSNEELEAWVPKVQESTKKVKRIYGYFNNHYHGYAPENCLQLIEKLGLLSEEQKKRKQTILLKNKLNYNYFSIHKSTADQVLEFRHAKYDIAID